MAQYRTAAANKEQPNLVLCQLTPLPDAIQLKIDTRQHAIPPEMTIDQPCAKPTVTVVDRTVLNLEWTKPYM